MIYDSLTILGHSRVNASLIPAELTLVATPGVDLAPVGPLTRTVRQALLHGSPKETLAPLTRVDPIVKARSLVATDTT